MRGAGRSSRVFVWLAGLSMLALVLAAGSVTTQTAAAAGSLSGGPDASPAIPLAQAADEGYLGSETCLACHDDPGAAYRASVHANPAHPGAPAAGRGCESCHGPGARHLEDPSVENSIRRFDRTSPGEASLACLTCHAAAAGTPETAMWAGSSHDARNLSCTTCHSVHAPASTAGQLRAASEGALCATCHRAQVNKTRRVAHMPVAEGAMTCSTCHNPHGAANVRLLRTGNWVNESCLSCHTEKRGPFLFEHAAGRESCVSCHDAHGSSNDRMLVARLPMLCQRCHIGTRHPSTIYDAGAVGARNNRIVGRSCVNCHSQIHGSNHPSGQSFTR
ncbi:MAG: DmsE family decaheme c-type cytochrome [Vicinamibacterales bacterium]